MTIHMIDPGRAAAAAIERAAAAAPWYAPTDPLRPGDLLSYGWQTSPVTKKRSPGHVGIVVEVPGYDGPVPAWVNDAEGYVGQGDYDLSRGGVDPHDGTPFDTDGRADCSGFAVELMLRDLGIDRRGWPGEGQINTTWLVSHAINKRVRVYHVAGPVDWRGVRVVHCSSSRPHLGAVKRTDGQPFTRGIPIRRVAPAALVDRTIR